MAKPQTIKSKPLPRLKASAQIQSSSVCESNYEGGIDSCDEAAATHLQQILWRLEHINSHLVRIGNNFNSTYYGLMETHIAESALTDDIRDTSGIIERLRCIVNAIECRVEYLDNAASRFSEI